MMDIYKIIDGYKVSPKGVKGIDLSVSIPPLSERISARAGFQEVLAGWDLALFGLVNRSPGLNGPIRFPPGYQLKKI